MYNNVGSVYHTVVTITQINAISTEIFCTGNIHILIYFFYCVVFVKIRPIDAHARSQASSFRLRRSIRSRTTRVGFCYGLNLTNGIFFDVRHLSHTHSAYTSAVRNAYAVSVSPVHPLKRDDEFNWSFHHVKFLPMKPEVTTALA